MSKEQKKIDEQTLNALLYLSRLSSESTNLQILKNQVDQIVAYFDLLCEYDESQNPFDSYPSTSSENLRTDEIVQGLEVKDIKRMTSEFLDGYFRVPKVLGDGA
ncbi:MAG: Asp-tRNA(Asn)/Glu-tRNA(Gln) amidotransferase subunit GatC [Treponemataceae bacterium]